MIKTISVQLINQGISIVDKPSMVDGLYVRIDAASNGHEVSGLYLAYKSGNVTLTQSFKDDNDLAGLAYRFSDCMPGSSDGSLVDRLLAYVHMLSCDDVERIVPMYVKSSNTQAIIDTFVIGSGLYYAWLWLLKQHQIRDVLPLTFAEPYQTLDVNVFSEDMTKYVNNVCTCILPLTHGVLAVLIAQVISYINTWGPAFDQGIRVDETKSLAELLSGYTSHLSRLMSKMNEAEAKLKSALMNPKRIDLLECRVKELEDEVRRLRQSNTSSC